MEKSACVLPEKRKALLWKPEVKVASSPCSSEEFYLYISFIHICMYMCIYVYSVCYIIFFLNLFHHLLTHSFSSSHFQALTKHLWVHPMLLVAGCARGLCLPVCLRGTGAVLLVLWRLTWQSLEMRAAWRLHEQISLFCEPGELGDAQHTEYRLILE